MARVTSTGRRTNCDDETEKQKEKTEGTEQMQDDGTGEGSGRGDAAFRRRRNEAATPAGRTDDTRVDGNDAGDDEQHPRPTKRPMRTLPGRQRTCAIRLVSAFKVLLLVACVAMSLSFLITGNVTFGYHTKLPSWRRFLPRRERIFTEKELARFDGTDPEKPIYLAISGVVYDVTAGRLHYGPNGSYRKFAGRDAARAFITGCFDTHLTHDLRGFTAEQLKEVDDWISFYENSDKYFRVGRVIHQPIDPDSPIPELC